jgi:aryl-phospho-beta-D-glucosidase BglC (GH1 family)
VQGALELRRKIFEFVILLLFLDFLIAPTLSLQSIQKISASGIIEYGRERMKWLRTNGKWIVDEDGNIVILRGANFMGYEFGAWNAHTEEDYARMASWGFNVVRLPITWHYIEPEPGVYNESYFKNHIDKDIAWAKKYGIYIILDMHQYRWSPYFDFEFCGKKAKGIGMPVWLVSKYPNSPTGLGQAVQDFFLGKGPNGTEASEANPSMKQRFIDVWKYVVHRYVNEPTIIGFDLLNEPPPPNRYNSTLLGEKAISNYLYSFYEELIYEIRKMDNRHIVFYQHLSVNNLVNAKFLNYLNIGFSFHYYGYQSNYNGNITELENDIIINFLNPVKNWNIPIFVGEFGIDETAQNSELYVKDILTIFDKYQLMYAWWSYWKSDTYGKSLLYANGDEKTPVQYLDRPYPRILKFPPEGWKFIIDQREFSLSLSEGSNFIQIYVPRRYFTDFKVYYSTNIVTTEIWNDELRILTIELTFTEPLVLTIRAV